MHDRRTRKIEIWYMSLCDSKKILIIIKKDTILKDWFLISYDTAINFEL